jgi:hypothetical protein
MAINQIKHHKANVTTEGKYFYEFAFLSFVSSPSMNGPTNAQIFAEKSRNPTLRRPQEERILMTGNAKPPTHHEIITQPSSP